MIEERKTQPKTQWVADSKTLKNVVEYNDKYLPSKEHALLSFNASWKSPQNIHTAKYQQVDKT